MDAIDRMRAKLTKSPLFTLPNLGVLLLEANTLRICCANARAKEILGYSEEALKQLTLYELCLGDVQAFAQMLENQELHPCPIDIRIASGEWRIIETTATFLNDARLIRLCFNDLTGVYLAQRVLTQLVRNTAKLVGEAHLKALVRELASLLRTAYAYIGECIESDRVRGLAFWAENDWQTPFEYDLDNTPCEIVIRRSACLFSRSVQDIFPRDKDLKILGIESYAGVPLRDVRGRPIGILWVCGKSPLPSVPEILAIMESIGARAGFEMERIRVEKELQSVREQLLQAQRMESIGHMAGGIAHDFNNMLTAILGYIELAQRVVDPQSRAYGFLESAIRSIDRAAEFTRQLLIFPRRQPLQLRPLSINAIVQEALQFAQRWLPSHIRVQTFLADNLWLIEGDSAQLLQVLNNLFLNARDAMPSGGTLTVETQNVEIDSEYVRTHYEVVPGEYVLLSVSDTGEGIPPNAINRIFEPFYTTKPQGQGTGLGLTVVYGIVKQLGGHIWVYSERGKGTTFKLYFPRLVDEHVAPALKMPPPVIERGSETILVVEDESDVRAVAVETLTHYGYTVFSASTPAEALQLAEKQRFDLLVTDVVLPTMSGCELADLILRIQPQIRVLYISGYTENTVIHYGVVEGGVHFLPKPYTPSQLAHKVRQVLDKAKER